MQRLTNWTARRAGAAITLTGIDEEGRDIKLTRVREIVAGAPHPVAVDHGGQRFVLA